MKTAAEYAELAENHEDSAWREYDGKNDLGAKLHMQAELSNATLAIAAAHDAILNPPLDQLPPPPWKTCSHAQTWIDDGVRYCEDCGYAC